MLINDTKNPVQIRLNSTGSYWGKIGTTAPGVWALGYDGASSYSSNTPVIRWTSTGNAIINNGYTSVSLGPVTGESTGWGCSFLGFNMNRNNSAWDISGDGNNNGAALIYTSIDGSLRFVTMSSNGSSSRTVNDATMMSNIRMMIRTDGNIGIGCGGRSEYMLAVLGSIIAEKVVVKNSDNWPDYVFSPNHKLPTLDETEVYIKANNHLEGVPTEAEVKDKGIDVAEMNMILLKKVEELTLLMIEQEKRIKELEKDKTSSK
jgi:hypothetical protein